MKISLVTISFNQGAFLERAIQSVLEQDYTDIEYILVDAGSIDGSRDIIERYRTNIDRIILESDEGPADGLNKGFSYATGEIYGFLNSDDMLLPHAISRVVNFFEANNSIDVVSGHSVIVDGNDTPLRNSYSNRFSPRRYAYGASELMQQSTFFKREMFRKVGGFNIKNCSNWDGELFVEMALQGAHFAVANEFWSAYRLHLESITCTRKLEHHIETFRTSIFRRIMSRDLRPYDVLFRVGYKFLKWLEDPRAFYERVAKGPIYGRVLSNQSEKH